MLLDTIRSLFATKTKDQLAPGAPDAPTVDPLHLAACVLLVDIAYADGEFTANERAHLESVLIRHFNLAPDDGAKLVAAAEHERTTAVDHFQFTRQLQTSYDLGQKMVLAEVMWGLVLADGQVAEHEHYLARKIANLLNLEPGYLSQAKASAAQQRSSAQGDGG